MRQAGYIGCFTVSEHPTLVIKDNMMPMRDITTVDLQEFSHSLWRGNDERTPLLGIHQGRAIYLLYNGILKDRSVAGGNVLTGPVFDVLPKFPGPKVIYAAANRIGARAAREGITFKQTPYALEV